MEAMIDDAGQLFECVGDDYIGKFDPYCLKGQNPYSPFVCRPKVANMVEGEKWRPMNHFWGRYADVSKVAKECPDLERDTKVRVAMAAGDNFEPQYFKEFDAHGNMWCYPDGKDSYTTNGVRAIIWNFWRVCEGPHEGTRNFNNKGNKK